MQATIYINLTNAHSVAIRALKNCIFRHVLPHSRPLGQISDQSTLENFRDLQLKTERISAIDRQTNGRTSCNTTIDIIKGKGNT